MNEAARDQITHRVVKGSLGACCLSSLSVLYLLFLQCYIPSTNEACLSAQLLWSVFISTKKYCLIYTYMYIRHIYLYTHILIYSHSPCDVMYL